ncbi:hypothetical protein [Vibrio neonatus]|uniref:hypothetical protein n=1 Tax=Vibrio neonatus TaxID=278860 RepID=UPI0021C4A778|nr:hypothetical protein [Vibrio neonatus]
MMKDEEMSKRFLINKNEGTLKINDHVINPEDLVGDPQVRINTQHCFCLCFSNRKDSSELYEKFKADVCIEVNVTEFEEFLRDLFTQKFQGMSVIGRDIMYYDKYLLPSTSDAVDLVFYKPSSFSHEVEYRIALFYPLNKPGFADENGNVIPFIKDDESIHITMTSTNKGFFNQFIGKVYEA